MSNATTAVEYVRQIHAAHDFLGGAALHDLETWTFAASAPSDWPAIPANAELSHGFTAGGLQHWVYTRRAPPSAGACTRCPPWSAIRTALRRETT